MKFLEEDEEELKGFRKWLFGLKLRWTHGIIPSIYDIKWGIKNLIKWFPHIWKWRSWSGDSTMDLLIQSLKFQKERLRDHSYEIDETLQPKILMLQEVIDLLVKSNDDMIYTDPINKFYDDLYGEDEMSFEPIEYDEKGKPKLFRMTNTRETQLGPEGYEKYREEWIAKVIEANKELIEDRKKAMNLIANYIHEWWE